MDGSRGWGGGGGVEGGGGGGVEGGGGGGGGMTAPAICSPIRSVLLESGVSRGRLGSSARPTQYTTQYTSPSVCLLRRLCFIFLTRIGLSIIILYRFNGLFDLTGGYLRAYCTKPLPSLPTCLRF